MTTEWEQHRSLITVSIADNVTMRLAEAKGPWVNFAGFWTAKFDTATYESTIIKFLWGTVRASDVSNIAHDTVKFDTMPWQILQVQTADPTPSTDTGLWNHLQQLFRTELETMSGGASMDVDGALRAPSNRIAYDVRQKKRNYPRLCGR